MQNITFEVKTGLFQGPLEILLELIEKKKLFINDISLAQITDDFIEYINSQEYFSKESVSQFISIAATLLLIKSKSLLPHLELSEEEEESIEFLENRLKQYKLMKNLSRFLKDNFGLSIIFLPEKRENTSVFFSPHPSMTTENIFQSANELLSVLPVFEEEYHPRARVKKIISLEEMVGNLTKRIKEAVKLSFHEFSKDKGSTDAKEQKINTVVSFLAVLELFKQGIINLSQKAQFSDIEIESVENSYTER